MSITTILDNLTAILFLSFFCYLLCSTLVRGLYLKDILSWYVLFTFTDHWSLEESLVSLLTIIFLLSLFLPHLSHFSLAISRPLPRPLPRPPNCLSLTLLLYCGGVPKGCYLELKLLKRIGLCTSRAPPYPAPLTASLRPPAATATTTTSSTHRGSQDAMVLPLHDHGSSYGLYGPIHNHRSSNKVYDLPTQPGVVTYDARLSLHNHGSSTRYTTPPTKPWVVTCDIRLLLQNQGSSNKVYNPSCTTTDRHRWCTTPLHNHESSKMMYDPTTQPRVVKQGVRLSPPHQGSSHMLYDPPTQPWVVIHGIRPHTPNTGGVRLQDSLPGVVTLQGYHYTSSQPRISRKSYEA